MKATLVVLAAGMGSRYGALKQMDAFGPNGETIIDYSIYDAINAGFTKVVFIIRESFRAEFEKFFEGKFADKIELAFVTQELHKIPEGIEVHSERQKPWGTAHAVMMASDVVDGPFAVINADDYYGVDAYSTLIDFFKSEDSKKNFAVVGYRLSNTLSDHGTVNRGVCYSDTNGNLEKVVECINIQREEDGVVRYPDGDTKHELKDDTLVSMNLWAFDERFFAHAERMFINFLEERGMELKSEFFIPFVIDNLINEGAIDTQVLSSDANWFGVTYQDDKPIVMAKLTKLIENGVYPSDLWAKA